MTLPVPYQSKTTTRTYSEKIQEQNGYQVKIYHPSRPEEPRLLVFEGRYRQLGDSWREVSAKFEEVGLRFSQATFNKYACEPPNKYVSDFYKFVEVEKVPIKVKTQTTVVRTIL